MNRRDIGTHLGSRGLPLSDRIKNLMRYYIECVREDEGQSVSVYLGDAGKRFILWPFPSDLSRLDDAEPRVSLGTDQLRFSNELRGTPGGGGLLYGYPTYIEVKQTARYAVLTCVDGQRA